MKRIAALTPATCNLPFVLALLLMMTGCSKEYSIETGNVKSIAGTWQFTENNNNYIGDIDTAYFVESISINELHLEGYDKGRNERFHLVMYSDTFKTGTTYNASTFNSAFDYGSQVPLLYTAGQTTGEFTVKIETINKSLITGTFSGKALKDGNDQVDITDGVFKAVFSDQPELPPSEGVLGNENGDCLPIQVTGSYYQDVPLNSTNTIIVQVNVNTPGRYDISTDPINDVTFSAKGVFTARGQQTVVLQGKGTPAFPGEQEFFVHYENSSCAFKVTFEDAVEASNDYFPTKTNTWWKYNQDELYYYYKVTPLQTSFDGKAYKIIGKYENLSSVDYDTAFRIRKDKESGNYYAMIDYSVYTGGTTPQLIETIFLKDNLPQGASWDGPSYTLDGSPTKFNLKFTILEKAVPANVNSYPFPDVIKVKAEIFSEGNPVGGLNAEFWYAKNVGLIYVKDFLGNEIKIYDFVIQ